MTLNRDYIGKSYPSGQPYEVGREKIREFADAIGDTNPAYLDPARAIVTGRVRSLWTDRYNRRPFPVRRLVKEVRGNLLLPWLHARFPGMPMALMSGWIAADAFDQDFRSSSFRARSAPLEEVRP